MRRLFLWPRMPDPNLAMETISKELKNIACGHETRARALVEDRGGEDDGGVASGPNKLCRTLDKEGLDFRAAIADGFQHFEFVVVKLEMRFEGRDRVRGLATRMSKRPLSVRLSIPLSG